MTNDLDDGITKNGMCRESGVCGVEGKWILGFSGGNHRERDNLEDAVVVGRIILKYI
jgi:hypothetical protein